MNLHLIVSHKTYSGLNRDYRNKHSIVSQMHLTIHSIPKYLQEYLLGAQ